MRSPQVRAALLHCTTAGYTPPRFDHKSFLVHCPVALLSSASYPILVHRLTVYVPRFLPTLGRPHAVALRFARRDQLATGLAPVGVRPCWAHNEKATDFKNQWLKLVGPPGLEPGTKGLCLLLQLSLPVSSL